VFAAVGGGFFVAGLVCLIGWLWCGPSLAPAKDQAWFSGFGFPAAGACAIMGAIWLDARRAWIAGRSGTAWGYCGLGLTVFVIVVGLFWFFGSML
jgi:hypothetical protein